MGIFLLVLSTALYCLVHSLTASNAAKNLARRRFGLAADRWYRLAFNLFSGISFLPILWLLAVTPDRILYVIKLPWLGFTTFGQLIGVAIILVGIFQTGASSFIGLRQVLSKKRNQSDAIFVDGGLYRWMRHPLYTGGLLVVWLMPLMTVNLLVLFLLLTLYLIIGARFEEKRLLEEFGDVYERYKKEVPMLIPKLR